MKGVSAIISSVLMIALVFGLAAIISPWLFGLTNNVANGTTSSVNNQIVCQGTGYDFDSRFGSGGVYYNLSGNPDRIEAKIINTGTISLYGFSMEIEVDDSGSQIIRLAINDSYQKTSSSPLKPGESTILKANISSELNGVLKEVKVLNSVCPSGFIRLRI